MNVIKEVKKGKEILRIMVDPDPVDPREWDNLGTMVCFHRNYKLGDNHDFESPEDFENWLEEQKKNGEKFIILPLFLYDHSGISISTGIEPNWYHKNWDSGQVGWIYVSYSDIRKEYNIKKISLDRARQVTENLISEVKIYNQYLTGDVYGFEIVKLKTCKCCGNTEEEHVDSCWGFYGYDLQNIIDHIGKEWHKVVMEK